MPTPTKRAGSCPGLPRVLDHAHAYPECWIMLRPAKSARSCPDLPRVPDHAHANQECLIMARHTKSTWSCPGLPRVFDHAQAYQECLIVPKPTKSAWSRLCLPRVLDHTKTCPWCPVVHKPTVMLTKLTPTNNSRSRSRYPTTLDHVRGFQQYVTVPNTYHECLLYLKVSPSSYTTLLTEQELLASCDVIAILKWL